MRHTKQLFWYSHKQNQYYCVKAHCDCCAHNFADGSVAMHRRSGDVDDIIYCLTCWEKRDPIYRSVGFACEEKMVLIVNEEESLPNDAKPKYGIVELQYAGKNLFAAAEEPSEVVIDRASASKNPQYQIGGPDQLLIGKAADNYLQQIEDQSDGSEEDEYEKD